MAAGPQAASQALAQAVARFTALRLPRLDAELLLAHVLGLPRSGLLAGNDRELTAAQASVFEGLLRRRENGEPVAYLMGEWEFWSLPLRVTPDVLIPRPETELLVEWALELAGPSVRIADLGTGSGAIALALARERPQARVLAVDVSAPALAVARSNAQALGAANVEFQHADFAAALDGRKDFDLIVSNPPYVAEDDEHLGALTHEPPLALVSGPDGLDALRVIVRFALPALKPGGWLLLEHGHEQGAAVRTLLQDAGYGAVSTRKDLEGRDRASGGRRDP